VHEYRRAVLGQNNVGPSCKSVTMQPKAVTQIMQDATNGDFGGRVLVPYAAH
jgi:hypothetical protein